MASKQLLSKVLMLSLVVTNIQIYSFANNVNVQQNKYIEEISDIETKEDLQKSAQKAVKNGEVDTWLQGITAMPILRYGLTSSVVNGKIYCIGGKSTSSGLNKVEVYDPKQILGKLKLLCLPLEVL